MRTHTSIHTWTLGVLVAVLASPVSSMAFRRTAAEGSTAKTVVEPFAWPGIYDMVATGYPDGERRAVIHIARNDTSLALVSLQGPPGTLVRFQVSGDSARVVWNLGGGGWTVVDLRGTADSLTGKWTSGDWFGSVRGVRRADQAVRFHHGALAGPPRPIEQGDRSGQERSIVSVVGRCWPFDCSIDGRYYTIGQARSGDDTST